MFQICYTLWSFRPRSGEGGIPGGFTALTRSPVWPARPSQLRTHPPGGGNNQHRKIEQIFFSNWKTPSNSMNIRARNSFIPMRSNFPHNIIISIFIIGVKNWFIFAKKIKFVSQKRQNNAQKSNLLTFSYFLVHF